MAAKAQESGAFDKSLVPVKDMNGLTILDKDEYNRPSTTAEGLGSLNPSFLMMGEMGFDGVALQKYHMVEKINHVHTPGNSSGIVDGASLVLIGSKEKRGFHTLHTDDFAYDDNVKAAEACPVNIIKVSKT